MKRKVKGDMGRSAKRHETGECDLIVQKRIPCYGNLDYGEAF